MAAASNGSLRQALQAGQQQQREPRRPQPDVGQHDDAEGGPALDQPGLAVESQPLEHGVHDPELIVEHPAHHDGGDHRRHHQRHQQHRLHDLLAAEGPVEQQRQRQAQHQRAGHAQDHEDEGVGQHDPEERRVAQHGLVVGQADPGLLGIVQRPVAEARIGADDDRHDLEQGQQQRRGRDQEQHESLSARRTGVALRPPFKPLPVRATLSARMMVVFGTGWKRRLGVFERRHADAAHPEGPGTREACSRPTRAWRRPPRRWRSRITPEMLGLIDRDDPADPIARQFVPSAAETEISADELSDPIGDRGALAGQGHRASLSRPRAPEATACLPGLLPLLLPPREGRAGRRGAVGRRARRRASPISRRGRRSGK